MCVYTVIQVNPEKRRDEETESLLYTIYTSLHRSGTKSMGRKNGQTPIRRSPGRNIGVDLTLYNIQYKTD